jgi:hypothetical protein
MQKRVQRGCENRILMVMQELQNKQVIQQKQKQKQKKIGNTLEFLR